MTVSENITIPGDEAYLTFGGWAKSMSNPPKLHERRRYVVDVECTAASVKTSEKGERFTRSLSILRVTPVAGVVPPPRADDEGDDTPPMFNDDGTITDDASADEGDEIMAERRERVEREAEDRARMEAEQAAAADDADTEDWSAELEARGTEPATGDDASDNVTALFREAGNE